MNTTNLKMSLLDFDSNDNLTLYTKLITQETKWLYGKDLPDELLFIPQGYDNNYYNTYINQVRTIFQNMGIRLKLITEGDPVSLINHAHGIVIGGGDLTKLLTATVSYLNALRSRIQAGTPYMGWNEGSVLASPYYVVPPIIPVSSQCMGAIPVQLYCHFVDTPSNRNEINNFFINHQADSVPVNEIVCMKDGPGGSGIQLEDDGSGILYSPVPGTLPPTVFVYQNGVMTQL